MIDGQVIYTTDISKIKSKSGTAAPQLRWGKNGKLQQAWQCVYYEGTKTVGAGIEWKDVPDEQ